jgi:hypothetical protein
MYIYNFMKGLVYTQKSPQVNNIMYGTSVYDGWDTFIPKLDERSPVSGLVPFDRFPTCSVWSDSPTQGVFAQ